MPTDVRLLQPLLSQSLLFLQPTVPPLLTFPALQVITVLLPLLQMAALRAIFIYGLLQVVMLLRLITFLQEPIRSPSPMQTVVLLHPLPLSQSLLSWLQTDPPLLTYPALQAITVLLRWQQPEELPDIIMPGHLPVEILSVQIIFLQERIL